MLWHSNVRVIVAIDFTFKVRIKFYNYENIMSKCMYFSCLSICLSIILLYVVVSVVYSSIYLSSVSSGIS